MHREKRAGVGPTFVPHDMQATQQLKMHKSPHFHIISDSRMTSLWRWVATGAILAFLIVTVSGVPSDGHRRTWTQYTPSQDLQEHGIITIAHDDDFDQWPGNGSTENPYVIENLTISGDDHCVSIEGTSAHFVIRNCLFNASDLGVRLTLVNNGTIERCRFIGGNTGISVDNSSLCRFENNDISGASIGLLLTHVNNITATANSIHHCTWGIILDGVASSFSGNDVFANLEEGLTVIDSSANNTFLTNAVAWNGRSPGLQYDAIDNGLQNRWDNGTHGNYWTDAVPGNPRAIPGLANSVDSVPALLTDSTAPNIAEAPEDVAVDEGEELYLVWYVSERFPDMCDIYIDSYGNEEFNWWGGELTLTREFSVGAHNVTVVFRDCSGNRASDTVVVQVIWGFFGGIGTEIVFASSILSVAGVLLAVAIVKRR